MMAMTPAIAANTAPTCGIVILAGSHLQGGTNTPMYLYNKDLQASLSNQRCIKPFFINFVMFGFIKM